MVAPKSKFLTFDPSPEPSRQPETLGGYLLRSVMRVADVCAFAALAGWAVGIGAGCAVVVFRAITGTH